MKTGWTRSPPTLRNIGVVFQSYAIFPHLTVGENIAYGLKARRVSPDRITAKVTEVGQLVQLEGLLDRMPSQLSGGQQQRVVLARALVIEPRLLLMDEPLSNLDAKLRVQIRSLIRAVQRELQITTIYVTHDQEEALAISDTIAVMDRGRMLQVGKPWELYLARQPLRGGLHRHHERLPRPRGGRCRGRAAGFGDGLRRALAVPPQARQGPDLDRCGPSRCTGAGANAGEAWNSLTGTVTEAAYLGAVVRYEVRVTDGLTVTADIHNPDFAAIRLVGDRVTLWFAASRAVLLPNHAGEA